MRLYLLGEKKITKIQSKYLNLAKKKKKTL